MDTILNTNQPKYVRLPRKGERCQWTGLCRSTLYKLILPSAENNYRPAVNSKVVRNHPGNARGIRLVDFGSLLAYLNRQDDHGKEVAK